MSEFIRVSKVDDGVEDWKLAREIFRLNDGGTVILDVIPVEGTKDWDIEVDEGVRALAVARLGQIAAITLQEQR